MYIFIYNYDFLSCLGEMEVWIGYEFLSTKMLVQNNQLCSIQYLLLLFFFFHISYLNITENTRDYIELLDFNIWVYIFKQSLLKNRFDISFVIKRNDPLQNSYVNLRYLPFLVKITEIKVQKMSWLFTTSLLNWKCISIVFFCFFF